MNRQDLNQLVQQALDRPLRPCSIKHAARSVDAVLQVLGKVITEEERIEIPELGVFEHRHGFGQNRKVPGSTVVEKYDAYWYVKYKPIKHIRETVRAKDGSKPRKKKTKKQRELEPGPNQIFMNF